MYPGDRLRFDILNPLCMFMLCAIGLLFVYSAQISYDGDHWKRQFFFIVVGVGIYSLISALNYKIFLQYAHFIYLVLAKVVGVFLLPMLLIFLQPDLGSTLVFPPMIIALLYISRLSEKFFLSAFAAFAIALAVLGADIYGYSQYLEAQRNAERSGSTEEQRMVGDYQSLLPIHNYQRNRILTFVAPDVVDPSGTGASWNANQAKISAATGGLSGKGLFKGTQAQLGYLPQAVAHNDFIFSVIAEETGFLGSAFIVGLFCLMVANGIRIAGLARDRFGMQLAIGVSILFLVHFFINIGMTIGITPITGLPLPFLSYGGSFVLSCFILQGLVQSVYRYRKDFSWYGLTHLHADSIVKADKTWDPHLTPGRPRPMNDESTTEPTETKNAKNVNAASKDEAVNDEQYTEELISAPIEKKSERINTRALKDDAAKREKKQPLIQRIVKAIKAEKKSYTELIINSEPLEKRVALLQDGVLEKFEVERTGEAREVGAIFKGRIQNLEPGLKAAFVDIGEEKNAFLHYWDILPAAKDNSIEIVRDNKSEKQRKREAEKVSIKDIPKLYPIGSEIVLQITKGQIGTKGPRTTTNIALPGRFLVLMPYTGTLGISRKIEDKKERSRLKGILRDLTLPEGMGIIVRTAGEGKKARYFIRDLHILLKRWEVINQRMDSTKKPACLYVEPDIVGRTVRDFLTEEIDRVMVDKVEDYENIIEDVTKISPRSKSKIHLFKDDIPVFERFNIERQIEQTYNRCVPLPGGGEIVIEETEALISIDVNTGSHKNKNKDGKDFILQVNLESATEICRQIRLRNIGGLIILDFIDMKAKKDRNAVLARMKREMAADKAKNHILPISTLGIMQMTRQRHSESHSSGIYTDCPYCNGRGSVKSSRTMSVEVQRRLISVIRHIRARDGQDKEIALRVLLHPTNLERLRQEDEDLLLEIEQSYGARLSFRADPIYHVENFKIIDIESGQEQR